MKIVLFYHSLLSDWNHGNAHFLRGIMTELQARGHEVVAYEPRLGWSLQNLFAERGARPIIDFHRAYPGLRSTLYDFDQLDLDRELDGANLVIAHEWNEPELIAALGRHHKRRSSRYRLLFHDTHHRLVTDPASMARYDLRHYDGVLAFGKVLRDLYLRQRRVDQAWVWHEAADARVFHPHYDAPLAGDLIWVGNWGDEERSAELQEFLINPVRELKLRANVHGVRYPAEALKLLKRAGIRYGGWLPNYAVPQSFAAHRCTVHVMRRPYVQALPGIPTIRVFEALACGIPLVCSPWDDAEGLFTPGQDYLVARDGLAMQRNLRSILSEPELARSLAEHGRRTILSRHTCAHRAQELLTICQQLGLCEVASLHLATVYAAEGACS